MARTKGDEERKKRQKRIEMAAAAAAAAASAAQGGLSEEEVKAISAAVSSAMRKEGKGAAAGAAPSRMPPRHIGATARAYLSRMGYFAPNGEFAVLLGKKRGVDPDELTKEAGLSLRNARSYLSRMARDAMMDLYVPEPLMVHYLKLKAKKAPNNERPKVCL